MKKSLFLATILISSFALTACSNKGQTESSTNVITSSSSSQEASTSTTTSSDKKTEETQVIGSDEYGFVKVPKSWIKFNEVQGGNDIQYSDGTDVNIVTLNTFKPEQFGISEEEYSKLILSACVERLKMSLVWMLVKQFWLLPRLESVLKKFLSKS